MEFSYLGKTVSVSLVKELTKRILVYVPLIMNIVRLRYEYQNLTYHITTMGQLVWWSSAPSNLPDPFTVASFVLTMITFKQQYTIRKVYVDRKLRTTEISFNGIIPAFLNLCLGVYRLVSYWLTSSTNATRTLYMAEYWSTGWILCITCSMSLGYSLAFKVDLRESRTMLYWKLCRFWKGLDTYVINGFFLAVCFFHTNTFIQVLFRLTFLVIAFLHIRVMLDFHKSFVKISFLRYLLNCRSLFLLISILIFFQGMEITKAWITRFKPAVSLWGDFLTLDFFAPTLLYIACSRHNFYTDMNTLTSTIMFGNSHEHTLLQAAFPKRNLGVVRNNSLFEKHLLERLPAYIHVTGREIYGGGEDIKIKYIKELMSESPHLFTSFIRTLQSLFGTMDARKRSKRGKFKQAVVQMYQAIFVILYQNAEHLLKFVTQVTVIYHIYWASQVQELTFFENIFNAVTSFILGYWCLYSFKLNDPETTLRFNLYIIMPTIALVQIVSLLSFYADRLSLVPSKQLSPSNILITSPNATLMIIFLTLYLMSVMINCRRLTIQNFSDGHFDLMLRRYEIQSQESLAYRVKNLLYEAYFKQFILLHLGVIIMITMLEVNLINLLLMFYSVSFYIAKKNDSGAWTGYVFLMDTLILVKIVICSFPKYGILNNIELMSIIGLYTLPAENNSMNIILLIVSIMITCYYIAYIDPFNTYLRKKTNLTSQKLKNKMMMKKEQLSVWMDIFNAAFMYSRHFIILSYHALISLLLTFDKKDFMTVLLFALEGVIVPLHLYYYLQSRPGKSNIVQLYRIFWPMFFATLFFVIFRYILFFQKFAFFHQIYLSLKARFGNIAEVTLRNTNGFDYRSNKPIFGEFYIEFMMFLVNAYTMIYLKRIKEKILKQEDPTRKSDITQALSGEPNDLDASLDFLESDLNYKQKIQRSLSFVFWNFSSQVVMSVILCKSLVHRPNLPKTLIMFAWLYYVVNLFKEVSSALKKLQIFQILDALFDYFRKTFISNVKAEKRTDFTYNRTTEATERLQLKTYYQLILREVTEIFRAKNRKIFFVLIVSCFVLNIATMFAHVVAKFDAKSDLVKIFQAVFVLNIGDQAIVQDDLLFLQFTVFWFFVDFGVYIAFFMQEDKLIPAVPFRTRELCVQSLGQRFDLYNLEPGRVPGSVITQKIQLYLETLEQFGDEIDPGLKLNLTEAENDSGIIDVSAEENGMEDIDKSQLSQQPPASLQQSMLPESEQDGKKEKKKSNTVSIHLSELTPIKDKILFIYMNKNKYFFGRILRSICFNIPRLSLCLMTTNLLFSQSYLDYLLLLICLIYSIRGCKPFVENTQLMPIMYTTYFLLNYMLLPCLKINIPAYNSIAKALEPTGRSDSPKPILLLGLAIMNVGFVVFIYWVYYSLNSLLCIKIDPTSNFHVTTMDNYLVIDYKQWKKGTLSSMNFIFKYGHSMILEIFALGTFVMSFMISGQTYFTTPVVVMTFLLVISDRVKALRHVARVLLAKKKQGSKSFICLSAIVIQAFCWLAIFLESYDLLKKIKIVSQDTELSPWVLLVFYFSLSVNDLVNSEEFEASWKSIKAEEAIKTTYIAVNMTYHENEKKLFKRISEFIGKEKLEAMAQECVMTEKFEDVKLQLDYNRKPLLAVLEDLYNGVLESVLSGPKLIKHTVTSSLYGFFHDNINHMRYRDLFVLYRNFLRRNSEIMESGPLDLRLYFSTDFKQFEEKLKDAKIFYELYREKDSFKMEKYQAMMQKVTLQIYGMRNYQSDGQTYEELSKRDWNITQNKEEAADDIKEESTLKRAADLLHAKITKDVPNQQDGVHFDNLQIELSKKGYVHCNFDKQKIVLYNLRDDYVNRSQGFLKFKFSMMISMFARTMASNVEILVAILMGAVASWNGGFINVLTLGIIVFKILIEENYGNLNWWKQLYVIYLVKLLLHLASGGEEKFFVFLNGYSLMADVMQIVLVNIVLFQQSKIGLSEDYMFSIEDLGQCVVRLIVNQEFEVFVDRMTQTSKSKIELIVTYLDQTFAKEMSQEAYRVFKTKCTMAIVSLYLEIEKFKTSGKKSAIKLFTRLKEDVFLDIKGEVDPFIWRNFSQYARKVGVDLTGYIYGNLTTLIFFTIVLLQYSETGRLTVTSFFSGTQAISSQTVITITFYIILLFIEKYFNSMTSNDSIGARYNPLFVEFCRDAMESADQEKRDNSLESLRDKLKRGVRKISNLARLKPSKRSFEDPYSNPFYYKYYFLITIWVFINLSCYIIQPNTANKGRNGYLTIQTDSYLCDTSNPSCFNYINLPVTKLFYLLNFLYFVVGILQIRKGKVLAIPEELDYNKTVNTLSFSVYYQTPILREICTLIEYSSLNTTLEIDDWLLVEDLKQYIIEAKISHVTNEIKNTGKTVERNERVTLSWTILSALMGLLIVPLLLFSTFASGDKEQEIISAELKVELFSNEDGYLMMLYRSNMLVDNRVLSDTEKSIFETNPNLMHLNRQQMRVLGFSASSDDFLDIEESSKDLLIRQLRASKNPFVRVFMGFETEDKLAYNRTFKLYLQDTLRDNMISVLFSKCQFSEKTKSSELFMQMTPQIMEFLTKEIVFRELDPNFTQKLGLSLRCEPNGKRFANLRKEKLRHDYDRRPTDLLRDPQSKK